MSGNGASVRRIVKEWRGITDRTRECLQSGQELAWSAHPICREQPYEWHFTIRGPSGTAFEKGMYHGKLVLPPQYPLQPPNIYFMTMNGRFDVGKPICLTVTQYHPEEWQPAWGIASILDALQAFLPTPPENAANALDWSDRTRQQLAAQSINFRCPVCQHSNKHLLATGHPFIDEDLVQHPTRTAEDDGSQAIPEGFIQSPLRATNDNSPEAQNEEVSGLPSKNSGGLLKSKSFSDSDMLGTYNIWSSIPLLMWYIFVLVGRYMRGNVSASRGHSQVGWTRRRILKLMFIMITCGFCLIKIYKTLMQIGREVWILSDFPIYRPGQVTVLGDTFKLTVAERTQEFDIHPWLQHL